MYLGEMVSIYWFFAGRILDTSVQTGVIYHQLIPSLFAREQQSCRQHCSVVCWIFLL